MFRESALIESTDLHIEDHGILTLFVTLNFGGAMQGFGGVMLSVHDEKKRRHVGTAAGMDFVLRVLQLFGVCRLSEIVGRECIALREHAMGTIIGLENVESGKQLLVSSWSREWFAPEVVASA